LKREEERRKIEEGRLKKNRPTPLPPQGGMEEGRGKREEGGGK